MVELQTYNFVCFVSPYQLILVVFLGYSSVLTRSEISPEIENILTFREKFIVTVDFPIVR